MATATWNGSTASYKVEIHETCDGGCDSHFDAIQAAVRSMSTNSWCVVCDTDATCSCTGQFAAIPQSLTIGNWKISLVARSIYPTTLRTATADRAYLFYSPGTAGANNVVLAYWGSGSLFFDVYDSGGVRSRATYSGNMSADTDYFVEAYHYANGDVKVCVDGSCSSTTGGADMDGVGSDLYIGSTSSSGTMSDLWIRNFKVESL